MTALLEASPPARKPRRQDAALAGWRRAKAVELACAGQSYDSIAKEVGYASRGTAWRTVQKALHERVVEGVDQLRQIELERLDRLQLAHWDRALAGQVASARIVLRIMEQRSRLLGLEWIGEGTPAGPVSIVRSEG